MKKEDPKIDAPEKIGEIPKRLIMMESKDVVLNIEES